MELKTQSRRRNALQVHSITKPSLIVIKSMFLANIYRSSDSHFFYDPSNVSPDTVGKLLCSDRSQSKLRLLYQMRVVTLCDLARISLCYKLTYCRRSILRYKLCVPRVHRDVEQNAAVTGSWGRFRG